VEEQENKKEQIKNRIFDIVIKYRNEASSDQRQVYFAQLWEQIKLWGKIHLYYNTEDMGKELFHVTKGIVKIKDFQKDKFLRYLNRSLKRARIQHELRFESSIIRIPKKLLKLEAEEDIIRAKEKQFNRKLTEKERIKYRNIWVKKENAKETIDISYPNIDKDISGIQVDNLIINDKIEKMIEGINCVIDKRQDRSRDCYRALFTVYCIRKKKYFAALDPVLDQEILGIWKENGKIPKQSAVYMAYHKNKKLADKSAESRSSNIIDDLNKRIKKYLYNKYPDFFS
jgi:hypothetical protein